MNNKKYIIIFMLFTFSYTKCMELNKSNNNADMNSTTIELNEKTIANFVGINKKKEHKVSSFISHRSKRLTLLQNLITQGACVTFSNQDQDLLFWLHREDNIFQQKLQEKLFFLLNYNTKSHKITLTLTHSNHQKTTSISLNSSLLEITITTALTHTTYLTLRELERSYTPSAIQQPRNPIPILPDQDTIDSKDESLKLSKEDNDLFITLPYNTQALLKEILLDHNNQSPFF